MIHHSPKNEDPIVNAKSKRQNHLSIKTILKHCKNNFFFKAGTLEDAVSELKRLDISKVSHQICNCRSPENAFANTRTAKKVLKNSTATTDIDKSHDVVLKLHKNREQTYFSWSLVVPA